MPYVTKVRSKGKSTRKHYSSRRGALTTARKALREVNKLKAASGPHLKDIDNDDAFMSAGTEVVTDTSAVTFISAGDGETDRTGDFINVRSILLDGSLNTVGNSNSMVHIAVVVDTQQAPDTNPSYSDVYETAPVSAVNGSGLYKIRRQEDSLGRFRVLWSKVLRVADSNNPSTYFKKYINFKKTHKVEYNGTGSGDIQKNGIYVIARCDGVAGATAPLMSWTTRIRFDP